MAIKIKGTLSPRRVVERCVSNYVNTLLSDIFLMLLMTIKRSSMSRHKGKGKLPVIVYGARTMMTSDNVHLSSNCVHLTFYFILIAKL